MNEGALGQHEIEVVAGREAAALARARVAQLGILHLHHRMAEVQLAVSEIVTNAVRHGGLRPDVDAVRITVGTGEDSVAISVEQPTIAAGVEVVEPRLQGDNPGGFGLRLVDRVADSWGHEAGPPGRVWLNFRRS